MMGIHKIKTDIKEIREDITSLSMNDQNFSQNIQALATEVIRLQGAVQVSLPAHNGTVPEYMKPEFLDDCERLKQYFQVIYTMYNVDEVMPPLINYALTDFVNSSAETSEFKDFPIMIQSSADFKYVITKDDCKLVILDFFYKYSLEKEKYEDCSIIKKLKEI